MFIIQLLIEVINMANIGGNELNPFYQANIAHSLNAKCRINLAKCQTELATILIVFPSLFLTSIFMPCSTSCDYLYSPQCGCQCVCVCVC